MQVLINADALKAIRVKDGQSMAQLAREANINLVRTASLNDDQRFMTMLAEVVLEAAAA